MPDGSEFAARMYAAVNIDTADTLAAALPKYIVVVVGLALLLLMVVFRSVWVPIKAAAGFLLTPGMGAPAQTRADRAGVTSVDPRPKG